jgi:hypothetical protein
MAEGSPHLRLAGPRAAHRVQVAGDDDLGAGAPPWLTWTDPPLDFDSGRLGADRNNIVKMTSARRSALDSALGAGSTMGCVPEPVLMRIDELAACDVAVAELRGSYVQLESCDRRLGAWVAFHVTSLAGPEDDAISELLWPVVVDGSR